MKGFLGSASGWSKGAFVLLFPALGIHCAGIGTVSWMKSRSISDSVHFVVGLWKIANCSGEYIPKCIESDIPSTYDTSLLALTRELEVISLILLVISTILCAFYVTSPGARIQKTAAWTMMLSYLSMGFSVGGAVAWTFNVPDKHYVYWSMGLTLVAAGLSMLSATLMIPDIRQFDYDGEIIRKIEKKKKKNDKKEKKARRKEEEEELMKY